MSKGKGSILASLQKLGKAMMIPIAVMPAAGLLLRFGQADLLNIPWLAAAGGAIFDNLPLLFAVGIAVSLADENNGVAGLASVVGYFVITKVAVTFDEGINMGVFAGIIVGIITAKLYNKFKAVKLPAVLGFFGGRRFVPIVTSFTMLLLGIIFGYIWPPIQGVLNSIGEAVVEAGSLGAFIFGLTNRLLIPFGLHHVMNSLFWTEFGQFTDAAGNIIKGDIFRFLSGDPAAGTYQTGFFPIMMFALPAACLAMVTAAKKENRKAISGMMLSVALTSFLTGITEPIEFSFMFLAPALYLVHAVLTGVSLAVTSALGMRAGFSFSAGLTDYLINFGISSKPIALLLVGLIFAAIYYFLFLFAIKKFNLPTPGRADDEESAVLSNLSNTELGSRATLILEAIGGKANISSIDACITRIRVSAKDAALVNEARLKELGATGVMKMGANNFQIIVGTMADPLVTHMKALMK